MAGRADRFMAQLSRTWAQAERVVGHVRAGSVSQPVRGRLFDSIRQRVKFLAALTQPVRCGFEHLLDDRMHGAARHRLLALAGQQQKWNILSRQRKGDEPFFAAIAR